MATYTTFEQLPCWQKSQDIKIWLIDVLKTFPEHEKYELTFSIRKCIRSATRNIAEGFGKHTIPDKIKFCRVSKGSLYELLDDLLTAGEEAYLTNEQCISGRTMIEDALRSINGYIRYLKSRSEGNWESTDL